MKYLQVLYVSCFLAILPTLLGKSVAASDDQQYTLSNVVVNKERIFDSYEGPFSFVPALVNALHSLTKNSVITRELWLKPGDNFTSEDVSALERTLRDLNLFAEVNVSTKITNADTNLAEIIIDTRDRLTIVFSAGGSFLGGIGEVKFSIGERNLFGTGQRLVFGYSENTEGELLGSLSYDNVLLRGTDVYGAMSIGQTEDGLFTTLNITDRFQNHTDRRSWSFSVSSNETSISYFDQGVSVAEVPKTNRRLGIQSQSRRGPRNQYWRYGPVVSFRDETWGDATGINASTIDVPEDSQSTFLGAMLAYDHTHTFLKKTWIDTLSYDQDIGLGYGANLLLGAEYESTTTRSRTKPTASLAGWNKNRLSTNNYIASGYTLLGSLDDGNLDAWWTGFSARWFNTYFNNQTIGIRASYQTAVDKSGLPPEQSLGEDTGLRGYPAREFNGEQRFLVNVETRVRTALRVASFDIGLLGFFDAGWVGDRNQSLSNAHTAAGFGLRFGSKPILGKGVIRLDFAVPFDKDPERDYKPTISLALGQVFLF